MSDGIGRKFTYLSSHATNRYFIPNWGRIFFLCSILVVSALSIQAKTPADNQQNAIKCQPFGLSQVTSSPFPFSREYEARFGLDDVDIC